MSESRGIDTVGVTGALGFIGSQVCHNLKHKGYDVRGIDNGEFAKVNSLDCVDSKDIRGNMKKFVESVDIVIHLAALSDLESCSDNPEKCYNVNIESTNRIAFWCEQKDVPLIFASSMATIGNPEKIPINSKNERCPVNLYGKSKLVAERAIDATMSTTPAISLILSNVIGCHYKKGEIVNRGNVLSYFIENAESGKKLSVYAPGEQARDFIDVKEVSRAFLSALKAIKNGFNGTKSVAIGSGKSTSVLELARMVSTKYDVEYKVVDNPRPNETLVDEFRVDAKEAEEKIDFSSNITLEETIKRSTRK